VVGPVRPSETTGRPAFPYVNLGGASWITRTGLDGASALRSRPDVNPGRDRTVADSPVSMKPVQTFSTDVAR